MTISVPTKSKFPLAILLFLAPVLLLLALSAREIVDSDTWWHLKTGEIIATQHQIPRTDPFSQANAGKPWVNFEWLSQLCFYSIYRLAGPPGLVLGSMFILALAVLAFALAGLDLRKPLLGSVLLTLAVIAASGRYTVRPEIFSYLFLGLFLLILQGYRQGQFTRMIWILPLLQVLWENLHGGTLLGIETIGAYAVGQSLLRWMPLPSMWNRPPMSPNRYRRLLLVTILVVLASLLNPWGPQTLSLIFKLQTHQFSMAQITEWQRTFALRPPWPITVQAYWALVAASGLGLVFNFRRLDLNHLLLTLGFFLISLLAVRNLALFALVTLPITARNFAAVGEALRAGPGWRSFRQKKLFTFARSALMAGLVFGCLGFTRQVITDRYYIHLRSSDRFGFGVSSIIYPWPLLDFLAQSPFQGAVFNDHDLGGYLIWRGWSRFHPFLDSRAFIYDPGYLDAYSRALQNPEAWKTLADRYHFQAALLLHLSGETGPLFRILAQDPEWVPVYLDESGAVFARRLPENAEWIARHRLDLTRPGSLIFSAPPRARPRPRLYFFTAVGDPVPTLAAAFFFQNLGLPDQAKSLLHQALAIDPDNPTARYNLRTLEPAPERRPKPQAGER